MPSGPVILIALVIGVGCIVAKPVGHAAKKVAHGVVHVVTLGRK